ncbi:LysR family transcriptional regulator substrate-binding protein [Streptomyces sp. DSM 40484]|uniref:LysR family transcriptional regulator substrate-binding protein n=1 Tax=Streptomyces kroppenstedtii TaxID=3051181 RepID=UPI0028D755CE|nr:LysR family transcriptional regulator substrate-binding protein [Streptomyces sp. DSM 40484]
MGEAGGGLLRIGCAQSLTVALLAPVLRDWRRRHPDVVITLHELAVMDEALRLVESDEVDVAVLPDPPSDRFQVTAITKEEIVLAAPTGHPLAQRASVRIQDLDGAPLVHYTAHNRLGAWLDQSFARAGVNPENNGWLLVAAHHMTPPAASGKRPTRGRRLPCHRRSSRVAPVSSDRP